MNTNLAHALALAAQGLSVFPVWNIGEDGKCACGQHHPDGKNAGKHPITPRGLHDATTDPAKVTEFWTIAPSANIGVAVPDGFCVVDVDPRNGGEATFDALPKLPPTRTAETGGAGGHFWFRVPAGMALPSTLGAGIDVKQLGGYVLAPPSNHASGGSYRWVAGADAPVAEAPEWLKAMGWQRGERTTVVTGDEEDRHVDNATLDAIVALVEPHFTEGKKHHVAKNLGGWLKQRGYGPGDVSYVIEQLPSKNPRERAKAAVAAFRIEKAFGWTELKGLLGDGAAAALDAATPNPRRAGAAAATASLVAGMAASAVSPVQAAAAPLLADGAMPAWYTPVELLESPPPIDYIVPDLELAPGRPNMVVGYSNVGKSISTQALAFAIAMGLPAWGQFVTKRRRVLYLDAENIIVTRENFARLAHAAGVAMTELRQWLTLVDSRFYMDLPNAEAEIAAVVQRERYGVVFVDTFRASAPHGEENKAEISKPLYMLGRVAVGTGAMFVVLHHEKKPDGDRRGAAEHMISGHASIHGALQVAISLLRDDDSGLMSVRPSKRIRRGFDPFQLKIVDVGGANPGEAIAVGESSPGVRVEYVGAAPAKPANEETLSSALIRILTWLRTNAADGQQVRCDTVLRTVELGGVGGKKTTNNAAMERLARDGQVSLHGSPKMISLISGAPPYDPRSVLPPVDPTATENAHELSSALYAQRGMTL